MWCQVDYYQDCFYYLSDIACGNNTLDEYFEKLADRNRINKAFETLGKATSLCKLNYKLHTSPSRLFGSSRPDEGKRSSSSFSLLILFQQLLQATGDTPT